MKVSNAPGGFQRLELLQWTAAEACANLVHPRNQITIALGHHAAAPEQESVALLCNRKTCKWMIVFEADKAPQLNAAAAAGGGGGGGIAFEARRSDLYITVRVTVP
jgi:hypothetical protein